MVTGWSNRKWVWHGGVVKRKTKQRETLVVTVRNLCTCDGLTTCPWRRSGGVKDSVDRNKIRERDDITIMTNVIDFSRVSSIWHVGDDELVFLTSLPNGLPRFVSRDRCQHVILPDIHIARTKTKEIFISGPRLTVGTDMKVLFMTKDILWHWLFKLRNLLLPKFDRERWILRLSWIVKTTIHFWCFLFQPLKFTLGGSVEC